jgi:hypothetical protein
MPKKQANQAQIDSTKKTNLTSCHSTKTTINYSTFLERHTQENITLLLSHYYNNTRINKAVLCHHLNQATVILTAREMVTRVEKHGSYGMNSMLFG